MAVNVLFAGGAENWGKYRETLGAALAEAGVDATVGMDLPPAEVDYIVYAPTGDAVDFAAFTRLKAVLSLWAGVERIVGQVPRDVPLARMVDPNLTRGMVEWVAGHVLRHHLGMDVHIHGLNGIWRQDCPPVAPERRVTVLGLGELGRASAQALAGLGFDVAGWSRSEKRIDGIACLSGPDGLKAALARAEILVLLLPDTPATGNVLNADSIALLPPGAVVLNPGRGKLIDDDALLAALDAGRVGHATLDTFRVEPLPPDHPYWHHEHVTVTPHIAAETRASSASRVIAENIRRGEAGEPFLHLVDRGLGY